MPDVVGETEAGATTILNIALLALGAVTTQSSNTVPVGEIISQNPNSGASVNQGSAVDIVVSSGVAPDVIDVRVDSSSDDAEEKISTGSVNLTSSDLEMTEESSQQTVGIRFNDIQISTGATITKAYVQFQTDETDSVGTDLTIEGEKIADAPTFISSNGNISSRTPTAASVGWSPVSWDIKGEAGLKQQTTDISSIVQEPCYCFVSSPYPKRVKRY